jgi:hypothetical protein
MRYLIPLFLLTACSSAPELLDTASQSQPVTTHTVTNGTAGLALPAGSQLCHYVSISGSGAGSTDPNGGGSVSFNNSSVTAQPNHGSPPPRAGSMSATVRCVPLTAFGPLVPSQAFANVPNNGQVIQSGSVNLGAMAPAFNQARACTLSSLSGHTHWDEYSWISNNGASWSINNHGPNWLATGAECVTLGRAGGPVLTLEARPGQPGLSSMPIGRGECLLQEIHGGINDGGVGYGWSSTWDLHVWGSVLYARALCWNY